MLVEVKSFKGIYCVSHNHNQHGKRYNSGILFLFYFYFFTLMIMAYGSREKSIMCFKLRVVCMKSIHSVLLSNGRGKNIWCTVTMPAIVSSSAVFCSAGRLLSVCLMIYQFYSNELTQSKCIIWSLITRASVLMFRSGHEAHGANQQHRTPLFCVQLIVRQAKVECCWTLIILCNDS